MRRRLFLLATVLACAAACGDVIALAPTTEEDAGADAAPEATRGTIEPGTPDVEAGDDDASLGEDVSATTPDASASADGGVGADATPDASTAPDRCPGCLTHHCDSVGGCDLLVFATESLTRSPVGNGTASAIDAICNGLAGSLVPVGTEFVAWVSVSPGGATPPSYPWDRLGPSDRPVRRADGVAVAGSLDALDQGRADLEQPIDELIDGGVITTDFGVWTGLFADGDGGPDCNEWTSSGDKAEQGNAASMAGGVWSGGAGPFQCTSTRGRLYCIQKPPPPK